MSDSRIPEPLARRFADTPLPRHRRSLPPHIDLTIADVQNTARCSKFGESRCTAAFCPRHRPENYAEYRACHATDSI